MIENEEKIMCEPKIPEREIDSLIKAHLKEFEEAMYYIVTRIKESGPMTWTKAKRIKKKALFKMLGHRKFGDKNE